MKKINVYIMKQLLLGFFLIALGMTALIWLSQSLRLIDWIVNKGVSVGLFIELTLLVLPNFIAIITPLAFFIVLLFVYQRLLADRELVVMKAAGMSAFDLAKPTIYVGIFLVFLGYSLTLWLVPYSVSQFKALQFKIRNNLAQVVIQEGEFNQLPNNVTAYVRVFRPNGHLEGILIHDDRNPEKRVIMVAQNGFYLTGEGGSKIVMHQGTRQEYNRKTGAFTSLSFEQNTMTFEESKSNKVRSMGEEELSLKRLLSVQKNEEGITPLEYREYKVEAFKRLTQPLYALVYLFVGLLPLLLGHYNRRGQSGRVYLAVSFVVLLQSLSLGFENLSNKNLWFLILMMANLFVPITFGFVILKRGCFIQGRNKFSRWLMHFFALFLVFVNLPSFASNMQFISDTKIEKEAPIDFEADNISYDQQNEIVTAMGNVYLNQSGTILQADKLVYNQKTEEGQASGSVVLTRPDGVKLYATKADLSDAFSQAQLSDVLLQFADGSTFKSEQVKRIDGGNLSIFDSVFFTPCTYCSPEKPLWDISASKVKHNYNEQEYQFYHAVFDVKGIPVFYWPYLSYPDFQVKRKTGFLAPSLASSSELGFGIELPFFWDISVSQDLYLSPTITSEHFPLIQGQYRGIYQQSKLITQFSMTQNKDDDHNEGHIKINYENDLTDKLRFTGQYYRASDHTYFRRYPIDNVDDQEPWIESFAKLEYFGRQSYGFVNIMDFQNLRNYVSNDSMPLVSQVDYSYVTKPFWNGLYSVSTVNGADVYRKTEERSSRLSVEQSFILPYISAKGFVFENQLTARADGYSLHTADDRSHATGRFYTNASTKISYPVMKNTKNFSQVIEPIVMAVWSPNSKVDDDVPNEDSLDVVFDDVNLFSANRYNGYDRVETGSRLNYGLQWSFYGLQNMYLSAMIGQSYRFSQSNSSLAEAGFHEHFSDYVGHLNMDFKDFGMGYRFRLNQNDFHHEMSEARFYVGRNPLKLSISYLYLTASKEVQINKALEDREEVFTSVSSKLTQNWSGFGYYRYDLSKNGGPIDAGGGLQYDNECLSLLFTLEKEFTEDDDYEGDTSFYVRLVLKTLGAI